MSAVTIPTLRAETPSRRSRLTSIPSTQWVRRVSNALSIQPIDCSRLWQMMGSNALSCNCPASAARVTVRSVPRTANAPLVDHLRNYRVYLAGHEAGSGRPCGQPQLPQTGLWSRRQQPQVVADLRDLYGG